MKRNLLLTFITLSLIFSCKNKIEDENLPTIPQSIEFINSKLEGKEITHNNGVYTNVKFGEQNGKFNYTYDFISAARNEHYQVVQLFFLKDIDYISANSFGGRKYLIVNLDKSANQRFINPLNERTLSDYGLETNEWLNDVFIDVRESDIDAVRKAFENIVKVQNSNRASEYFEQKD